MTSMSDNVTTQHKTAACIGGGVISGGWVARFLLHGWNVNVFAQVQAAYLDSAIIGSSTSGFKPSQLQENALNPQQIMVAHPFNPVYLLPLVALVPSPVNNPEIIEQAKTLLTSIGMKPLHVRKEIDDGFGLRWAQMGLFET